MSSQFLTNIKLAIFVATLLFIVPSTKKNKALVNWEITKKLPWHIVFLFGGGFALAKGFVDSGLSNYIGSLLTGLGDFSPGVLVATPQSLHGSPVSSKEDKMISTGSALK